MEKNVQIAVRTSKGRQTLTVPSTIKRKELMDKIEKTFGVQVIGLRISEGLQSKEITDDVLHLKDRDFIVVVSPVDKTEQNAKHQTISIEGGQVVIKAAPEEASKKNVVEDEIDQTLSKTDGWTVMDNTRGYRTPDDYIAPWNIQNHPKWAYQNQTYTVSCMGSGKIISGWF